MILNVSNSEPPKLPTEEELANIVGAVESGQIAIKKERKQRKLPVTITEAEFLKLFDEVELPHHKLAFALGFYECMRISEILNLQQANVDKQVKIIHILNSKGGKDRDIPIAPEVMKLLRLLPVPVGERALQIAFKGYARAVLDKDMHFHCLRHSGITHYLNKGWNSLAVQRFAGHSKITTTEIYTHIRPLDLVDRMWKS